MGTKLTLRLAKLSKKSKINKEGGEKGWERGERPPPFREVAKMEQDEG